jgi:hypothetical protein
MEPNIQDTEDAIGFGGNQDGAEPDSPLETIEACLLRLERLITAQGERIERLEADRTIQTVKTLP